MSEVPLYIFTLHCLRYEERVASQGVGVGGSGFRCRVYDRRTRGVSQGAGESRTRPDVDQVQEDRPKRFRGGLVFKAHRFCVSLNSRLESNIEEEEG